MPKPDDDDTLAAMEQQNKDLMQVTDKIPDFIEKGNLEGSAEIAIEDARVVECQGWHRSQRRLCERLQPPCPTGGSDPPQGSLLHQGGAQASSCLGSGTYAICAASTSYHFSFVNTGVGLLYIWIPGGSSSLANKRSFMMELVVFHCRSIWASNPFCRHHSWKAALSTIFTCGL